MKRHLLVLVFGIALLCFGCTDKSTKLNIENADEADIYYGYDSHVMHRMDAEALKTLSARLTELSFEPTDEKTDQSTKITVFFYKNKGVMTSVSMDKNGVFSLGSRTGCYKVSSGSFDYELLKNAYTASAIKLNVENADEVCIFYGVSSYAMASKDTNIIKALASQFSSLAFVATNDKIDFGTMFTIGFYRNDIVLANVKVDKNSVFWLHGDKGYYKISSGSFDYEYVKNIYTKN